MKRLQNIDMVDITHDKLFCLCCLGFFLLCQLVLSVHSIFSFPLVSTVFAVPFQEVSDDRMKKVNELFQGMKLIKLYAWETIFCHLINEVRWKQIRLLFKSACINALNSKFPTL